MRRVLPLVLLIVGLAAAGCGGGGGADDATTGSVAKGKTPGSSDSLVAHYREYIRTKDPAQMAVGTSATVTACTTIARKYKGDQIYSCTVKDPDNPKLKSVCVVDEPPTVKELTVERVPDSGVPRGAMRCS